MGLDAGTRTPGPNSGRVGFRGGRYAVSWGVVMVLSSISSLVLKLYLHISRSLLIFVGGCYMLSKCKVNHLCWFDKADLIIYE